MPNEIADPHGRIFLPRVTRAWYVACQSRALGGRPLASRLLGVPLVLFRDENGRAAALLDRCAHRNVPLSLGRRVEGRIQCAYHGWSYDAAGRCVRVPGLCGSPPENRDVEAFPVTEQDGFVWVFAAGSPAAGEPFRVPAPGERSYATIRRTVDIDAPLHAAIENVLDVPHTAFLHRGLFRGSASPNRIRVRVTRGANEVRAEYLDEPRPTGLAGRILSPTGGVVTHVDRFVLPSIAQVEYRIGGDVHLLVTVLATPVEDFRTRLHAVALLRTRLPAIVVEPVFRPVVARILRQDVEILRAQSDAVRRFGGEHYRSTEIDVLGAQVGRLLRRAESGAAPEDEAPEGWRREFEMEA